MLKSLSIYRHHNKSARIIVRQCLIFLFALLFVITSTFRQTRAWNNGQLAQMLLGQQTFVWNYASTNQYGTNGPDAVAVDPKSGKIFVSDHFNDRVLRFPSIDNLHSGPFPNFAEAVFGQVDFNNGIALTTQNGMNLPAGIAIDANGTLWVADEYNSRILRFDNAASKPSNAPADAVLGQPDFTSSATATTQNGMKYPFGVTVDVTGTLWVADEANSRILRFDNAANKANGAPADGVLGQPDFSSSSATTTQNGMYSPSGVTVDTNGTLWVADWHNNRVLRFDSASNKTNGANADGILGQPDFVSNTRATTQNGVWQPAGVAIDNSGNLWVADEGNSRAVRFDNAALKANGANADGVLGQADFISNANMTTQNGMYYPVGLAFDGSGNLWVADLRNNRALYFINNPPGTNTPTNTLSPTFTPTNTPANTPTLSPTATVTETLTSTPTVIPSLTSSPTFTATNTPTNTPTLSPTATFTATLTSTLTPTATLTSTPTHTATATSTPTSTSPPPKMDTIGIFRAGKFYLRLHNSTGYADLTVAFTAGTKPYPIVGDWTGAGVDTVGVYDQSNGQFTLCTANLSASCANSANLKSLVLGVPNDQPLSGRWLITATNAGVGVFRPSNGLIYLKNALTTGYADNTMVLGVPSDVGVAGDWNGKGFDSPGVYRPGNSTFYLSNQVTNSSVIGDYQVQYGLGGDSPVTGDWITHGHDGIGLFRQSNGFTYLKNQLVTGYADNAFTYGIAGDIPVAGYWQSNLIPTPTTIATLTPTTTPTADNTPTASLKPSYTPTCIIGSPSCS